MEHNHTYKPIQGGGTGQGFRVPPQVMRYEGKFFIRIAREAICVADRNTPKDRGNQLEKHKVWTRHLQDRFFFLHQRKQERKSYRQITTEDGEDTVPQLPFSIRTAEQQNYQSSGSGICTQSSMGAVKFSLLHRTKEAIGINGTVAIEDMHPGEAHVRYIPGLPKTIEEVITLWRRGSTDGMYKPVRLFEKSSTRKDIISNYDPESWFKGGQKSAYFRFKEIVFFAHEMCPVVCNVWEEGLDEHWKSAIVQYNLEMKDCVKPVSMSALVLRIRREK